MLLEQTWQNLSEGQGSVIASFVTLVAALSGVALGWLLFSRRVTTLEKALEKSEAKVQDHLKKVESLISDYASEAAVQLKTLTAQLNQVSATLADAPAPGQKLTAPNEQPAEDRKEALREAWTRIRDRLEAIATKPGIDGRTIAKYGRIDRRQYGDLVAVLDNDGQLGPDKESYRQAVDLWHRFRNGKQTPSVQDVARMEELKNRLTDKS